MHQSCLPLVGNAETGNGVGRTRLSPATEPFQRGGNVPCDDWVGTGRLSGDGRRGESAVSHTASSSVMCDPTGLHMKRFQDGGKQFLSMGTT